MKLTKLIENIVNEYLNEQENFAYHVTRKKNLPSIKRKGLEPRVPEDYGNEGDVKGVYLFKTADDLENALWNWLGERIDEWEEENDEEYDEVILRVNISGLKKYLIDSVEFEWICTTTIEPSRITDVTKDYKKYLNEQYSINETWYHVSPVQNRNTISTDGLIPTNKKRYGVSKDVIYLWKYKEIAIWYALTEGRDYNKNFDIYQINQNLDVEEDTDIGVPEAYYTTDEILPENITMIDTVMVGDKRMDKFGDIDDVLDMIDIY